MSTFHCSCSSNILINKTKKYSTKSKKWVKKNSNSSLLLPIWIRKTKLNLKWWYELWSMGIKSLTYLGNFSSSLSILASLLRAEWPFSYTATLLPVDQGNGKWEWGKSNLSSPKGGARRGWEGGFGLYKRRMDQRRDERPKTKRPCT